MLLGGSANTNGIHLVVTLACWFCQSVGVAKRLEEHSDVHAPGCGQMDKRNSRGEKGRFGVFVLSMLALTTLQ